MKPRQDFDLCVINVVERVCWCAFYREKKNWIQTNIQKKIWNYRFDCREHMARLHFTSMQSLATQFPEFLSFAKQISPNVRSIWHNMFWKKWLKKQKEWTFLNNATLALEFWQYKHKFDHTNATTQATKELNNFELKLNIEISSTLRLMGLKFRKLWKQLRLGWCWTFLAALSQWLFQLVNLGKYV